jgi:hypothetical protein
MSDITPLAGKSNEEPAEPVAQLFDFLYRDPRRIESLYAQFFEGLFMSLQKKSAVTYGDQKSAKLSAAVAEGGLGVTRGTLEEKSEMFQPHDNVLLDLLSRLETEGWIEGDYEAATPGRFVLATGTIFFADRYLLSVAEMGLELAMRDAKAKGGAAKADVRTYEMIRKLLPKMSLASSFYLRTESGRIVTGTIKEEGLDEPISAYYFKHGAGGIANVRVLGIKEEVGNSGDSWGSAPFFEGMRQAVGALRDMFFPPDDIRVTPIAVFRTMEREAK